VWEGWRRRFFVILSFIFSTYSSLQMMDNRQDVSFSTTKKVQENQALHEGGNEKEETN